MVQCGLWRHPPGAPLGKSCLLLQGSAYPATGGSRRQQRITELSAKPGLYGICPEYLRPLSIPHDRMTFRLLFRTHSIPHPSNDRDIDDRELVLPSRSAQVFYPFAPTSSSSISSYLILNDRRSLLSMFYTSISQSNLL